MAEKKAIKVNLLDRFWLLSKFKGEQRRRVSKLLDRLADIPLSEFSSQEKQLNGIEKQSHSKHYDGYSEQLKTVFQRIDENNSSLPKCVQEAVIVSLSSVSKAEHGATK